MYNETCMKIISMEEEIIHAEEEDIEAKSSGLKEEQQADESEEGEEESGWTSYLDTESSSSIDSSILLQLPEISAYNYRSSRTNYCYNFINDYNSSLLLCQDQYRVVHQNTTAKYSCDNFFCCKYMLDDCQTVAQSGNMSDVEEEEEGFREAAPCLPDQESLGSSSTTLSSTASDASCNRSNVNMRINYSSAIISGGGAAADQYLNGPYSSPPADDVEDVVQQLVMPMIHRFSNSCSRNKLPQNQQTFKRNRSNFHARFPADRSVLGLQQLDHHLHLQDTASSCSPASTLAREINLNGEAGDVSQRFKALEALIPRLKEVAGNANEEEMLNVIINHVQNLELKVELLSNVWRLSRLQKY